MKLTYYDIKKTSHLVEEFYSILYTKQLLPIEAVILPLCFSGITYSYSKGQEITINNNNILDLKGLLLIGQFNKPYTLNVKEPSCACGINFKPTALHKLTNLDICDYSNNYHYFDSIDNILSTKFKAIFKYNNKDFNTLFDNLEDFILKLPLIENKNTIAIDHIINIIHLKEGLISVNELLKEIPFSQKTLETQFKKMVGLTPAKYIRIYRFKKLMKRYENKKISLKDLIYMYDYYDESHFAKDFKLFTKKSFKEYFKEDFFLIKEILKNNNYDYLQ